MVATLVDTLWISGEYLRGSVVYKALSAQAPELEMDFYMLRTSIQAKWDRIYSASEICESEPAAVLAENAHLLPPAGDALDLACGLGGNALFLARRGFNVSAWDLSPVAVECLAEQAVRLGLKIDAQARDVEAVPFPRQAFDVAVVSRFLSRTLARPILDSIKPGGLLFYQTYVREKLSSSGPNNPDYLLEENELLGMFGTMRIVVYREEGRIGSLTLGRRHEAYFVGQKRMA